MKKIFLLLFLTFPLIIFAQNIEQTYKIADSLLEKQDFNKAIKFYKQIISNKPQEAEAIEKLGKCYFGINKIDSAKFYINKAINIDKSNAEYYSDMAKIFISQNQADSALIYIKSAEVLAPRNSAYDVIEGSVYLLQAKIDTAMIIFKRALRKNYKDADALSSIAYIYSANNMLDSALYYINKAQQYDQKANFYKIKADIFFKQNRYSDALFEMQKAYYLDSSVDNVISLDQIYKELEQYNDIIKLSKPYVEKIYNPDLYYYTIIAYYNLGETDSALYYLSLAHKYDSKNDKFYYVEGFIDYSQKKYTNAFINFLAAIEANPKEPNYFFLASKSKIMANTDQDIFGMNEKFTFFNQKNLSKFKKLARNKNSQYYYQRLLSKINTDPTSLSLDEYFMLYVGNAYQKGFSGYTNNDPQLSKYFEQKEYKKCIDEANSFIQNHPASLDAYFVLANSYYALGNYDLALKYLIPYYGFTLAIIDSGNGNSTESPLIVTGVADEYAILRFFGFTFAGQSFLKEKKHTYDIIKYTDNQDTKSLYFNIDIFQKNKR